MSPELQPMTVQYYCHVTQSASSDQYTPLPLRELWSRDSDVYLTNIRFGVILTQFMSISRDRNIK